jgi:pimeloyl-ACP methyl ester carboxylesterase
MSTFTDHPVNEHTGDEVRFSVAGVTIAGRSWGRPSGQPTIALHGWLDNCASFNAMAPLLENINLLALDMAGHGLSGFRSPDSSYNIWQDVPEIFSIANQQGWSKFSLIGHSRGAIVSSIAAGTMPERIEKLVLIDTMGPDTVEPADAPAQLEKATRQRLEAAKPTRYYPSLEEAAATRLSGRLSLGETAALELASRGVSESEKGFYWHADQRLKNASDFKLGAEHAEAFLRRIQCPTLLCMGGRGIKTLPSQFKTPLFPLIANCEKREFSGGHHLHMEESADSIAAEINRFFENR